MRWRSRSVRRGEIVAYQMSWLERRMLNFFIQLRSVLGWADAAALPETVDEGMGKGGGRVGKSVLTYPSVSYGSLS